MSLLGLGRIPASGTDPGANHSRPPLNVHNCPFLPYMGRILPRDKGRSVGDTPAALIKFITATAGGMARSLCASAQIPMRPIHGGGSEPLITDKRQGTPQSGRDLLRLRQCG